MKSLLLLTVIGCLSFGVSGWGDAAAPPQAASDALADAARQLASSATQRQGILALGQLAEPAVEPLLRALKEGALYATKGGLGVLGDDGTLKDVHGTALTDRQGTPLVPTEGQEAVALEEDLFGVVQGVLERLQVFGPTPAGRKTAAFRLGNSQDATAIPILRKARERETDREVQATLDEALAKLGLTSLDPALQSAAIRMLGQQHAESALGRLRGLTSASDTGVAQAAREAVAQIERFLRLRNAVGYLFNGVSLGAVLLLMSIGLAVTFGLMGIINMAHGEMLMIGSYAAYVVQNFFVAHLAAYQDYYFFVALPLSFLAAGLVGLALERGMIRFLYGRPLETLILTWGVGMILQQGARLTFGDQTSVNSPTWFRGGLEIASGLILPWSRLFIVGLAIVSLIALWLLLNRSRVGTRIRAVMQNRAMASCVGISARRIDALTFAFGTALAGVAGCALALIGTVDPEVGKTYIVDSFMVVVLGGVGNLLGAVVASLGIGIGNKLLEPAIGGTAAAIYAKVAILAGIIWFLQWKPTGLFPAKGRGHD